MEIINLKTEPKNIPTLAQWHHKEWLYLNPSFTLGKRIKKMDQYLNNKIIPSTFVAKKK